jgi:hypothetical protein
MVVACLALFTASAGTGVAMISTLPAGSVGTAQLQNNAVISSKVKDRSLLAVDFALGQLPREPKGATGATGPSGATHVVKRYAIGTKGMVTSSATVHCNTGEVATGGGAGFYNYLQGNSQPVVIDNEPYPTGLSNGTAPSGWKAAIQNIAPEAGTTGGGTLQAVAWVIPRFALAGGRKASRVDRSSSSGLSSDAVLPRQISEEGPDDKHQPHREDLQVVEDREEALTALTFQTA